MNTFKSESLDGDLVDDALGFRGNISKIIKSITEPLVGVYPGIVAITGPWGSGKTNFLKHVAKGLTDKGMVVFGFSTWQHELEGDIIYSLTNSLVHEDYYFTPTPAHFTSRIEKARISKLRRTILSDVSQLGLGSVEANTDLQFVIKILARLLNKFKIASRYTPKSVDETIPVAIRIHRNFVELAALLLRDKERMYILVDDLDRCNPDAVVRFLESIKNLVNVPTVTFVMALDLEAANHAICKKYSFLDAEGELMARRYFEKLFDLSFAMPKPIDIERFALQSIGAREHRLIDYLQHETGLHNFSDHDRKFFGALLLAPQFKNPRVSKSIMYTFSECVKFLVEENKHFESWRYYTTAIFVWLFAYTVSYARSGEDKALSNFIRTQANPIASLSVWEIIAGEDPPFSLLQSLESISLYRLSGSEDYFLESLVSSGYVSVLRKLNAEASVVPSEKPDA